MPLRPARRLLPFIACLACASPATLSAVDLLKDRPTGLDGASTRATTSGASSLRDLRLSLGIAPGIEHVDVSTSAWSGSVGTDAKPSLALTPSFTWGGFWSNGLGLGASIGVPWRRSAGTASNGDRFSIKAYGLEIAPLVALRLDPQCHLELAIPFAAGFADHEMPGLDTDRADWWSTGVRLGGYWTALCGFQVGGELGWLAMSTMGRVKDSGGSMDVTYHSRGPTAALTIGYRF